MAQDNSFNIGMNADLSGSPDEEGGSNSPVDIDRELSMKEGRIIRRGKRNLKDGPTNGVASSAPVTSFMAAAKNSRKSRNAFTNSRGEPKKGGGGPKVSEVSRAKRGGGGGKGVWGKPGSEMEATSVCLDRGDPNYDSDNQGDYTLEQVEVLLTKDEIVKLVQPTILEYFEHCKTQEVEDMLADLNFGPNKKEVAKLSLTIALEKHNPQRELVSQLISDLYGKVLSMEDIAHAFDDLLENINDLILDTPDAAVVLGQFIARCIADDCLAPKFITGYKGRVKNDRVKDALEKAEVLLSMNHGMAHLDNIWGTGGGTRPVRSLTNKIIELLKEYLSSGDMEEARRCLIELEVPHFHHELVYQAGAIVLEVTTERSRDKMVALLKYFTSANVVVQAEFDKGIRRLYKDTPDISIDVPAAYFMLEMLMEKLKEEGLVSSSLYAEMPSGGRGRKRFVSEGDEGRLKAVEGVDIKPL